MREMEKESENDNSILKKESPTEYTKINSREAPSGSENSHLTYFLIFVAFLIISIFLFFYLQDTRFKVDLIVSEKKMIKPFSDNRQYRLIKLSNNLEVLMISDPDSSSSAASLSVGVGSFNDDSEIPGLAHFCEHMIFLGSKTYPLPSQFEDLLSTYFGSTNAFTSDEQTTFFFNIANEGFDLGLKIFSKMFSEPLFDLSFMEKEINAVNSENEKNLNDDTWRQNQVLRTISNPKSPFHKFGTGNNKTLNSQGLLTLNQKLFSFYKQYYVPSNMRLVVSSNINLNDVQEKIAKYFSEIKVNSKENGLYTNNLNNQNNTDIELPFNKDNLGKIVWYKKLTSSKIIDLIFSLDETITKYKTKPLDYISYMIKYSGKNSLINILKKKKLASNLVVGNSASTKSFSLYTISLTLTELGFKNVESVIEMTFQYLNLIRENKVKLNIYNEIFNISNIQFKFLEKNQVLGDYLSSLSLNMFQYDNQDIIFGDYIHSNYNETIIQGFINNLTAKNVIIMIGSSEFPSEIKNNLNFYNQKNETEHWYGTNYVEQSLNEQYMKNLSVLNNTENFVLRGKNLFITNISHININEDSEKNLFSFAPKLFFNSSNLKIWHRIDNSFLIPKQNFYLNFVLPQRTNVSNYVTVFVFFNYLKYSLESSLSDAVDAGNEINFEFNENGINLSGSTYSDTSNIIIERILDSFLQTSFDLDSFSQVLEISIDLLKESKNSLPYIKAKELFKKLIKENVYIYTDMLEIIGNLNYSLFTSSMNLFKKDLILTILLYGKIEINSVEKIKNSLLIKMSRNPGFSFNLEKLHSQRKINGSFIYRTTNDLRSELDGIIENYYQVGYRNLRTTLKTTIIQICWGNLFYYELRTIQQLGYIVASTKSLYDSIIYFIFVVQSSNTSPAIVDRKIDDVLIKARQLILSLKQYQFDGYIESIRNDLLAKDNNLKERSDKNWKEIVDNTFQFNYRELLLRELDTIKMTELITTFDDIFLKNPNKISIQINAGNSNFTCNNLTENYFLNDNIKTIITSDINIFHSQPFIENNLSK